VKRVSLLAIVIAVIALLAWELTREPTLASPLVGKSAPGFAIPLYAADSSLSLAALRGRPVVLNFWASWCLSCRDEARILEAGWQTHRPAVAFVGVAVEDEENAARAFIARYGKTYYLGPDAEGTIALDYGIHGVPETFFLGSDGRIVSRHIGPLSEAHLERGLRELGVGAASR
jgi:cytochrome c biogenesis protein CcmG/thiol:disulfide interchange protein DsbE